MSWSKITYDVKIVSSGERALIFFVQKKPEESKYMVLAVEIAKPASDDDVSATKEILAHHAHEVVGGVTYRTLAMAKRAANARGKEWLSATAVAQIPIADPCQCADIQ